MDFKVAYTADANNIQTALDTGKIDSGDMVLVTDDNSDYGDLVIINANSEQVKISTNVRKFDSMTTATEWLGKVTNPPVGELVSIFMTDKYVLYTINESEGTYSFETSSSGSSSTEWISF